MFTQVSKPLFGNGEGFGPSSWSLWSRIAGFGLILLFLAATPVTAKKGAEHPTQLNVLLITIDTLRPDRVSCYSQKHVKTPHIDALAQRGVVFTRAFAHTPTTLPSHTNVFLGATPPYHGVHDNSNFIVKDEFLTLAEHLKAYSYSTAAFVGAFPLDSRFGLTQGFDVYDDNYGSQTDLTFSYVERRAEEVVGRALDWLQGRGSGSSPGRDPWFVWVHCYDPHQKYDPPEPFKSQYAGRAYEGEVAYVDHALGKLFSYLEGSGQIDSTLVILTADHGESLGEHGEATHGYFAYNSSLWVPLIVSAPGEKAGRFDQNVCHVDIFPTVCDLLGLEKPEALQGVSLRPALSGNKLKKRVIYFESLYPHYSRGWAPLKGLIQGQEKYFESPIPEFYDLAADFDELQNLADSSQKSGLVSQKKINGFQKDLARYLRSHASAEGAQDRRKLDRQALEKLQSLGYISTVSPQRKSEYTAADDLKTLLPHQKKLMKAMGAYHRGDFAGSASLLQEVIAARKDFDHAYSYLATLYKEQGRLEEAVRVMQQGLEHNPSSYTIICTYGIVLTAAGRYQEAIDIFDSGLELIDYDPELWNYLGVACWRQGDFKSAQEAYDRALTLDGNNPVVFNNLGSLNLSRALQNKQSEDLRRAVTHFQKAIELDPQYASAYNGLGSAYARAGKLDAAISCWEQAVSFKPDYAYPLYNLGLSYLSKGEKSRALDYFTRYKNKFYPGLSTQEQNRLDALIAKCH
jgi:arylsulfatase A-like enzyme/Flp pilus assembly protein TadD